MKNILIINQHGDNRGDEAAMVAMVDGLAQYGDVSFVLFHQFRDPDLPLAITAPLRRYSIILSIPQALGMLIYSTFKLIGLHLTFFLDRNCTEMVEAVKNADMVVSSPGGPYFGDIYKNHEIVHWFFVWLGVQHRKKLFLYAPSCGPFKSTILNPIRRYFFKKFHKVCLREHVSEKNLKGLMGDDFPVTVTVDSALQRAVEPMDRKHFKSKIGSIADKFVVAITAIKHKYPGANASEKEAMWQKYLEVMSAVMERLCEKPVHFIFLPQLYGKVHSDLEVQQLIADRLPESATWEMVDPSFTSDQHQQIVGISDMVIACRYHPQIFAASAGVPALCIYYEHKTLGILQTLKMTEYAHDIFNLDTEAVLKSLDELLANQDRIRQHLAEVIPAVRDRSRLTTQLALTLLDE